MAIVSLIMFSFIFCWLSAFIKFSVHRLLFFPQP
jgi:hypothetical protein